MKRDPQWSDWQDDEREPTVTARPRPALDVRGTVRVQFDPTVRQAIPVVRDEADEVDPLELLRKAGLL